jgi:sterol desaturase/sphingolipid hydroxylase (fatty acid hydroxylase superfamily)
VKAAVFLLSCLGPAFILFDFWRVSSRSKIASSFHYAPEQLFDNTLIYWFFIYGQKLIPLRVFFLWAGAHSIHFGTDQPPKFLVYVLTFFLADFSFYVWHFSSHRLGALWLAHQIHHQDPQFNFLTNWRVSVLEHLTTLPFLMVPVLLGVPFKLLVYFTTLRFLFMGFVHSSYWRWPRWVEAIFNTPSHHRVHHHLAVSGDQGNYGGMLMIWDRIFGTYQSEQELITRFGVKSSIPAEPGVTSQVLLLSPLPRDRQPLARLENWEVIFFFSTLLCVLINVEFVHEPWLIGLFLAQIVAVRSIARIRSSWRFAIHFFAFAVAAGAMYSNFGRLLERTLFSLAPRTPEVFIFWPLVLTIAAASVWKKGTVSSASN